MEEQTIAAELAAADARLNLIFNFITAFAVVTGPIIIAWLQHRTAIKLAQKVEVVKTDLQASQATVQTQIDNNAVATTERLAAMEQLGHDTHAIVNRNLEIQLHITAMLARRLAVLTKLPEDLEAAILAERTYEEHRTRQALFDEQVAKRTAAERPLDEALAVDSAHLQMRAATLKAMDENTRKAEVKRAAKKRPRPLRKSRNL